MSAKYLVVFLNDSLPWDPQLNILIPKLKRAIGLRAKIRHCTPKYLLKTIYCSFFISHLIYASQIWGQSKSDHFRKLVELQDKALRIINFLPDRAPLRDIYKNSKILKLPDYIALQNTLLIKDFFNEELPKLLNEHFKKLNDHHQHATVPLHTLLFLFLKYTQKRTEKIISSINKQYYGTTFTKYYKSICCSKAGLQKN